VLRHKKEGCPHENKKKPRSPSVVLLYACPDGSLLPVYPSPCLPPLWPSLILSWWLAPPLWRLHCFSLFGVLVLSMWRSRLPESEGQRAEKKSACLLRLLLVSFLPVSFLVLASPSCVLVFLFLRSSCVLSYVILCRPSVLRSVRVQGLGALFSSLAYGSRLSVPSSGVLGVLVYLRPGSLVFVVVRVSRVPVEYRRSPVSRVSALSPFAGSPVVPVSPVCPVFSGVLVPSVSLGVPVVPVFVVCSWTVTTQSPGSLPSPLVSLPVPVPPKIPVVFKNGFFAV